MKNLKDFKARKSHILSMKEIIKIIKELLLEAAGVFLIIGSFFWFIFDSYTAATNTESGIPPTFAGEFTLLILGLALIAFSRFVMMKDINKILDDKIKDFERDVNIIKSQNRTISSQLEKIQDKKEK
jgi:hypothetical protein